MISKHDFEEFRRLSVTIKALVMEKLKEKYQIEYGKPFPEDEQIDTVEYSIEDRVFSVYTQWHGKYGCGDREYYGVPPEFLYDPCAMDKFKEEIIKKKAKEQLEKTIKEREEHKKKEDAELQLLLDLAEKYNFKLDKEK